MHGILDAVVVRAANLEMYTMSYLKPMQQLSWYIKQNAERDQASQKHY